MKKLKLDFLLKWLKNEGIFLAVRLPTDHGSMEDSEADFEAVLPLGKHY